MSQDEPASEAGTSRQFSLRSLLWFVVLTSLWCSQIAVVRRLVLADADTLAASSVVSVLVAWIAMSWFCLHQRVFFIFIFQCVFPALMGFGVLLQHVQAASPLLRDWWYPFFEVTLSMNLFWFPIVTVIMAVHWAWPAAKTKKRHDRRMPWWP